MLPNPCHDPWCHIPSLVHDCPEGVPINAGRVSPAMTAEVTSGQLRDDACA